MAAERVVAAAIFVDGIVYALPQPSRHHHIIWGLARHGLTSIPVSGKQGFVTSDGRFVDRSEAARLALASNQTTLDQIRRPDMLFSEDLW